MKKLDFNTRRARVNRNILAHAETFLKGWLDGELHGEEFVAINSLRDDNSAGSFSINITTGVWKDFAVEDFAGPDLVSLYMALHDLEESAALDALETQLSETGLQNVPVVTKFPDKSKKADVQSAPAPQGCHLPPDLHPDLGVPSITWEYKTAEGQTAFYVYRFDTDKGKETRPVSYNPERQDWQWKLPAPPLPVYQLDRLTHNTDAAVVVVEGEKAADAAMALFPDYISTTSASGSSNALKSDWSPLHGRDVTLIPDADEPGIKYAKTVAAELLVNGSEVSIIDSLALGWSDGEDVADYPDLDQNWLLKHRVPLRDWPGFREMDDLIVEAAARLSPLDYDRRKDDLVELLGGVNKRTLDSMVKKARQAYAETGEEADDTGGLFAGEETLAGGRRRQDADNRNRERHSPSCHPVRAGSPGRGPLDRADLCVPRLPGMSPAAGVITGEAVRQDHPAGDHPSHVLPGTGGGKHLGRLAVPWPGGLDADPVDRRGRHLSAGQ
ncbi:MAG: hypothetical protein PVI28_11460 [Gammaproteobacteria bacterium]|jgi:hypothetical protein